MHWTLALVRRDLGAAAKGLAVALLAFVLVGAFLTLVFAANADTAPAGVMDQRRRQVQSPAYGISTLAGLVAFGAAAATVYGRDVQSGSVQELFHYPLTANRVHAAKVVNAALVAALAIVPFVMLVITPMLRSSGLPWSVASALTLRVAAAVLLANVLLVAGAAGLALVAARVAGGLALAFHRLYAVLAFLAVVATEAILEGIGFAILQLVGVLRDQGDVETYMDLIGAVVQLSPVHAGGRVLGILNGASVDHHLTVLVPLSLVLLVVGAWMGRRIYPELFLARLTA